MRTREYNRKKVVDYAKKWAYARNKKYYDFEKIGGDCTNFVSQCIYAGSNKMNYDRNNGWYYNSVNDRSPSWTGVQFLYDFLLNNNGVGPFASMVAEDEIQLGDIIQLSFDGKVYSHNLVVVSTGDIRVAAHSFDIFGKSLFAYSFRNARFIHIEGVRV